MGEDTTSCYVETGELAVVRALKTVVVIPIVMVLVAWYVMGCLYERIKLMDDMPMATAVGMAIPLIILIAMLIFGRFEGL